MYINASNFNGVLNPFSKMNSNPLQSPLQHSNQLQPNTQSSSLSNEMKVKIRELEKSGMVEGTIVEKIGSFMDFAKTHLDQAEEILRYAVESTEKLKDENLSTEERDLINFNLKGVEDILDLLGVVISPTFFGGKDSQFNQSLSKLQSAAVGQSSDLQHAVKEMSKMYQENTGHTGNPMFQLSSSSLGVQGNYLNEDLDVMGNNYQRALAYVQMQQEVLSGMNGVFEEHNQKGTLQEILSTTANTYQANGYANVSFYQKSSHIDLTA